MEEHQTTQTQTEQTTAAEQAPQTVSPGNRARRRMLAAIARRMAKRPGRGYTKRSAAQDQIPQRKSEHLKLIKSMKDNLLVAERAAEGAFDKYLDKDYGPELAAKYRTKRL